MRGGCSEAFDGVQLPLAGASGITYWRLRQIVRSKRFGCRKDETEMATIDLPADALNTNETAFIENRLLATFPPELREKLR